MKTLFFAIITASLFSSCVPVIRYGPVNNPGGQSYYQNQGQQRRITGYTRQAHTINQHAYIEVGGDAPQGVTASVRAGLVEYAENMFHRTGSWPSRSQLSGVARGLYARQGYNLSPSSEGQPGGFAVVRYQPGLK